MRHLVRQIAAAVLHPHRQLDLIADFCVGKIQMQQRTFFYCDFALLFRIGAFHQFSVGKLFCFIIQPADRQHNSFAGFIIEFCVARTDQMSKAIGRVFKKSIEL